MHTIGSPGTPICISGWKRFICASEHPLKSGSEQHKISASTWVVTLPDSSLQKQASNQKKPQHRLCSSEIVKQDVGAR